MKTLCFSLWFALAASLVPTSVQAVTLAPIAQPTASPLPATEPEPATDGACPLCKMEKSKTGDGKEAEPGKTMDCCGADKDGKDPAKATASVKDHDTKEAEAEKAVMELEVKWCGAEARHDVEFLEKAEADGFIFTDSNGKVTTKKDEIEEAKQGGEEIKFKLSDMKAHVYGDTVVLTGQTTFLPTEAEAAPNAYRWTDIFVRQASGEWQVVASQTTTIGRGGAAGEQSE